MSSSSSTNKSSSSSSSNSSSSNSSGSSKSKTKLFVGDENPVKKQRTSINRSQQRVQEVIDLIETDEDLKFAFAKTAEQRALDIRAKVEDVESQGNKKSHYSAAEKEDVLKLVLGFQKKNHCSERQAIDAVRLTICDNPPSRSTIQDWLNKKNNGKLDIDQRVVNEEFEKEILKELWLTEMNKIVEEHQESSPDVIIKKMKNILYTHEMCATQGGEVSKRMPFCEDARVKRIKEFSSKWASGFLKRAAFAKRKINPKDRGNGRPTQEVVRQIMSKIQSTIIDSGLPAENVFTADEGAVFLGSKAFAHYSKKGFRDRTAAEEVKRIVTMAAISVAGISMPSYIVVKCQSKKADLKDIPEINTLFDQLQEADENSERWKKMIWTQTLQLPDKDSNELKEVEFTRPYIIDTSTQTIVTCHSKDWLDTAGVLMWCDIVATPWARNHDGRIVLIWNHSQSHNSELIHEYFLSSGITLCTLPEKMVDILQVLYLVFNGPLKAHFRRSRYVPIFHAFQDYINSIEEKSKNKNGATPVWELPTVEIHACIQYIVDFVEDKNTDEEFQVAVKKCFVKAGQWFSNDATHEFLRYEAGHMILGSDAVGRTSVFGNEEDSLKQDSLTSGSGSLAPPELTHALLIERSLDCDEDQEDDLCYDESLVNEGDNSILTESKLKVDLKLPPGPPMLSEDAIDHMAKGREGPANLKRALQERGDRRKTGFTKKSISQLVQNLKDREAERRSIEGIETQSIGSLKDRQNNRDASSALNKDEDMNEGKEADTTATESAIKSGDISAHYDDSRMLCIPKCKCPPQGDSKPMIACKVPEGCPYGRWYHFSCLCLNEAKAKRLKKWICPRCQWE